MLSDINKKLSIKTGDTKDYLFPPTKKNYVGVSQISVLDTVSTKKYVFISLFPTYICVILGSLYPNLIGTVISNINLKIYLPYLGCSFTITMDSSSHF